MQTENCMDLAAAPQSDIDSMSHLFRLIIHPVFSQLHS